MTNPSTIELSSNETSPTSVQMQKYTNPPDIKKLINRPRTEFWNYNLVGLTHELKSPLAAIESALEVMSKPLGNGRSGNGDYFHMIKRNVKRLKMSVDDLLDLYTLGGQKRELNPRHVDLVKICREETHRYQPTVLMKGLSFECNFVNQPSLRIKCDASKIRLVLSNLISNAIKYTSEGSIRITVGQENNHATVAVQDSGRGIPAEDLPFVFDGFYQANRQTAKGSGIGLSIAKIWVQAHKGDIFADSDGPGKGSRFWFKIPMA